MTNPAYILQSMRPRQWIKNLLLFAGLIFAQRLGDPRSIGLASLGFMIFCMLSGSIYMINDAIDAERDRLHPSKRARPIAAGKLGVRAAWFYAIVLVTLALLGAGWISVSFLICAVVYWVMMLAYSLVLKQVFLIDTTIIALGFLIRAVSGVIVLRTPSSVVPLTPWFVICVFFLSYLLAFCKRRGERSKLNEEALKTRPVLRYYSFELLDVAIGVCSTGAILSYALYATYFDRPWMMLTTLPFVVFGIFRYLYIVYNRGGGEAPEQTLVTDGPLISCILLWAGALLVVYAPW